MHVSNDKLSLITAIVCDDMRREDNGKEILIGVYSSEIILATLPSDLQLFFWIPINAIRPGRSLANFRIIGTDDALIQELPPLEIDLSTPGSGAAIVIGGIPIRFTTPGCLRLDARLDGASWSELKAINVRASPHTLSL